MWWFNFYKAFNCCLHCWWLMTCPICCHLHRSPSVNTKLHRLSLSYHQILSRCICRQLRCHSSALMKFLSTMSWKISKKFQWNVMNVTHLEYAGAVRCSPCVQQIIFTRWDEPLSTCCKAQWENATLMQVQLIFVWFCCVKHFNMWILHSNCQPITYKNISWNYDLWTSMIEPNYLSDNIQERRFVSWSRVVEVVDLLEDPTISQCYPDRPSIILTHQGWCQCTTHHPCVLGIVSRVYCCSDPIRQCCHRYSTRSKLLSRVKWLRRNMLVRLMSIRL